MEKICCVAHAIENHIWMSSTSWDLGLSPLHFTLLHLALRLIASSNGAPIYKRRIKHQCDYILKACHGRLCSQHVGYRAIGPPSNKTSFHVFTSRQLSRTGKYPGPDTSKLKSHIFKPGTRNTRSLKFKYLLIVNCLSGHMFYANRL